MSDGMPSVSSPSTEKMLFLQENMVHFVNQMSMPVIEVSLVLSKYLKKLVDVLEERAQKEGEELSNEILNPWPINSDSVDSARPGMPLQRLLEIVDVDRMDILDTMIRTIINGSELPFVDAVLALRRWEHLARSQLAKASGTGQLFSPIILPADF
ncbi:MAG: hypothetical protein QGH13_06460 [Candidatus Thalassarchaeaceae archaeon]|nr:hypothetical protein [Candidatus Thalassarchaeaceae archaeon]